MQRMIIVALIVINLFTLGLVAHSEHRINSTLAGYDVRIAKAETDVDALQNDLRYLTDPETIQTRTIDYILRQGEFSERP